jgi:hypothetical protein
MKVGDLVKFKKTGACGLIIEKTGPQNEHEGSVSLYISDGSLDNTPSSDGFTYMSYAMLKRTAKVMKCK